MKYRIARVFSSILVWMIVAAASVAEASTTLAYVTNTGSNTVSVIDTSTNTVVGTILVGVAPAGIAATPDGAFLYVANSGNGTVSVVDTASGAVVWTIPVGVAPAAIAISPDGSKVYVANSGSDSVSVVSTASNTVVATVSVGPATFVPIYPVGPAGSPYSHMAVSADGSRVYVTNTYPFNQPLSSSLKVIDTATNTVSGTVQLSQRNSGSVELSPDGTVGYVTGWFGYLQTFSLTTNTQTQAFSLSGGNSGISLAGIATLPNSPLVYVAASEHNAVYVVDPAAQTWAPIAVGAYPTDVSFTPDASFAYVTNRADSTVSVIDVSSNSVIASVAVGPNPSEVAFAPGPGKTLTFLGDARLWIGLKNSDDQGTRFDVLAEVYKNGTLVASGLTRCVANLTRNPANAVDAVVSFDAFDAVTYDTGDVASLKVLTRIGTNPNGTKCTGHSNARGLRLYYGSTDRPSRFSAQLVPDPLMDFFLGTQGSDDVLDDVAPAQETALFKDSASVNFGGGNAWKIVGLWSRTIQ